MLLTGGAGQTAFAQTLADDFGIPKIDGNVDFAGRSDKAIAMDLFRSHGIEPSEANWRRFCAGYLSRLEEALVACKGRVLAGRSRTADSARGARRRCDRTADRQHARGRPPKAVATTAFGTGSRSAALATNTWNVAISPPRHLSAAELHLNGKAMPAWRNPTAPSANRQVIVIGDTPHDIRCGRSIGARCVGVPTGTRPLKNCGLRKPDVFVETLENRRANPGTLGRLICGTTRCDRSGARRRT